MPAGQSPRVLGVVRTGKRGRAWRFWMLATVVLGCVVCVAGALKLEREIAQGIRQEFYVAAMTTLPVLLLALLLRTGRISKDLRQLRGVQRNLEHAQTEADRIGSEMDVTRASAARTGDLVTLQQLAELQRHLNERAKPLDSETVELAGHLSELTRAVVVVSLVVTTLAGVAALIALATGRSSWFTLAFSGAGMLWLVLALGFLEVALLDNSLDMNLRGL